MKKIISFVGKMILRFLDIAGAVTWRLFQVVALIFLGAFVLGGMDRIYDFFMQEEVFRRLMIFWFFVCIAAFILFFSRNKKPKDPS